MASAGVSKLWSCGSLADGYTHVMDASAPLDEQALQRELQDPCPKPGTCLEFAVHVPRKDLEAALQMDAALNSNPSS